ncbi:MAG: hypothetical protein ABJD11_05325 [Gemmatimonadota bacterium]
MKRVVRTGLLLCSVLPTILHAQTPVVPTTEKPKVLGVFSNPRVMGDLHYDSAPSQNSGIDVFVLDDTLSSFTSALPGVPLPRAGGSPAVVKSRRQSNLLWTLDFIGSETELYAADTLGRDLGTYRVNGAANANWAAIALGRCNNNTCLYVGDTGDSAGIRTSVQLYRMEEPLLSADRISRAYGLPRAERLEIRYPDRPVNVSAMVVAGDGGIFLFSDGMTSPASVFRIPPGAWFDGHVIASRVGRLPIDAASRVGPVTGAAISRDGSRLAIRTSRNIYVFPRTSSGSPDLTAKPASCDISRLIAPGQGLDWLDDHRLLMTTIRGRPAAATILAVPCSP